MGTRIGEALLMNTNKVRFLWRNEKIITKYPSSTITLLLFIVDMCHLFYPLGLATTTIKGTLANSTDPDQTPQNAASYQGLHRLHLLQELL